MEYLLVLVLVFAGLQNWVEQYYIDLQYAYEHGLEGRLEGILEQPQAPVDFSGACYIDISKVKIIENKNIEDWCNDDKVGVKNINTINH